MLPIIAIDQCSIIDTTHQVSSFKEERHSLQMENSKYKVLR
jgi:hypothetical protein